MHVHARLAPALAAALLVAGCAAQGPSQLGDVQSAAGMADLVRIRAAAGLGAVRPDPALERAAAEQAGFMADAAGMAHATGRGRDFVSRMRANGIDTASAENIAHAGDLGKVFALWEGSPPHRRNMLDPRFTRYGLASAPDGAGKRYWALVLGR
jgi:uncharacterized protein YkwD